MPLIMDVLECDARRGFKPPMFLGFQPLVHARLQCVQFLHRGLPGNLHRQAFKRFLWGANVNISM